VKNLLCALRQYSSVWSIDPTDRCFRDAYTAELHSALSETDFANFYDQGRKMKLDEATKLALEIV